MRLTLAKRGVVCVCEMLIRGGQRVRIQEEHWTREMMAMQFINGQGSSKGRLSS